MQPLEVYEARLTTYHTAKLKMECTELAARTKMKGWSYLPSIRGCLRTELPQLRSMNEVVLEEGAQ
ncbi:hypothetical protein [Spirosoma flavus]